MINKSIIKIPKIGIIGFHPSKLPLYRGRSTIAWQIEEGVRSSAYTAFFVNSKPDAGDVILSQNFIINKDDYVNDVLNKVDKALKKMLPRIYKMMKSNSFPRVKQNLKKGFYKTLRSDNNSIIVWNRKALEIFNKIRAVSHPYPGAFFLLNGKRVSAWYSKIIKNNQQKVRKPGTVVKKSKDYIVVMTKDKLIKVFLKKI